MKNKKINQFNLEDDGTYEFFNIFQSVINSYSLLLSSIRYNLLFTTDLISIAGKVNKKNPNRINENGRNLLEICSTNFYSSLRNLLAMIINIILEELNKTKWNDEILPFIYNGDFESLNSKTLHYIMKKTNFLKFCFSFNLKNNKKEYSFYNFASWFTHKKIIGSTFDKEQSIFFKNWYKENFQKLTFSIDEIKEELERFINEHLLVNYIIENRLFDLEALFNLKTFKLLDNIEKNKFIRRHKLTINKRNFIEDLMVFDNNIKILYTNDRPNIHFLSTPINKKVNSK